MNKKEEIIEYLNNLECDALIYVHREYCDSVNAFDDEIYSIEDADEIFYGQSAEWLMNRIFYGNFNPNADYFKFNGYGNIQSIWSYELKDYIDIDEIAQYCVDYDTSLYDDEIREILNGEEIEDE